MTARIVALAPARLAKLATRANAAHTMALDHAQRAVDAAIEAGSCLLQAKAQLVHGQWIPWLTANVSFGRRCASNYMTLARAADKLKANGHSRSQLSIGQALRLISDSNTMAAMSSSSSSEFFTPKHIAQLAVAVLGKIDCDPAAHPDSPVMAKKRFFSDDDGLSKRWRYRSLYLNPPFREADQWVSKLVESYEIGDISQALLLSAARTDSAWFQKLTPYPVAFLHGRLRFANSDVSSPFPTAITYFGRDMRRFSNFFGKIGTIRVQYRS